MTPAPRYAGTPDHRTSLTRVTFLPRLTALVFGGGFPTPFGSLLRLPGQGASAYGHGSPERSRGGLRRRLPWDAWSCVQGSPHEAPPASRTVRRGGGVIDSQTERGSPADNRPPLLRAPRRPPRFPPADFRL